MSETRYYIKKPIVVSAYQAEQDTVIHTLEGDMRAEKGSYIITGVRGEVYPCEKSIFEESYQEVSKNYNYYNRDTLIRCEDCGYNMGYSLTGRILCDNWKVEVDGKGCFYGKNKEVGE